MTKRAVRTSRKVTVYHVGFLTRGPLTPYDAQQRNPNAYEGPGLSVSMTPRAWTHIAKLGGRPTWALTRHDGRPGLFAVWSRSLQAKANTFGLKAGLLQRITVYNAISMSEDDEEYVSQHDTREEALEEVYGDESMVTEATDYAAPGGNADSAQVAQAAALGAFLAQRPGDFDGIWWEETYDPYSLSAPRGVILPHAVTRWQATPSDYVEDAWEDA